ncbi:serine/threonine-protein kinase RsbW [Marmoricola sp. OAE513]|uniref:anti-sigma factor n=1 Tax=Marmoricola sp. OAE513 TaxID=2817894 RepID=UPI001AE373B7
MHPDAQVRLPADTAYVAVLRMATSGIAARLDFTLDDIEDLKMAISEASALVLADATPSGSLTAEFFLSDGRITIEVSADVADATVPDPDGFTWQVLTSTAADVHAAAADGRLTVSLSVSSTASSARA